METSFEGREEEVTATSDAIREYHSGHGAVDLVAVSNLLGLNGSLWKKRKRMSLFQREES